MSPNAPEDLPRQTHQEILEEKHVREDRVVDMLHICHCIIEIGQMGIYRRIFSDGSEVRDVLDVMMG